MEASIKPKPILIFSLVAILSAFLGSHLQNYFNQIELKDTKKSHDLLIQGLNRKSISFLLFSEENNIGSKVKNDVAQIEKMLSPSGISLALAQINSASLSQIINSSPDQYRMGLANAFFIETHRKNNNRILPIFAASPDLEAACFNEIQVFIKKDNPIEKLEDLNDKVIGIVSWNIPLSLMPFEPFLTNGFNFKKIYTYSTSEWASESLRSGKIDAFVEPISTFENKANSSRFGRSFGTTYPIIPHFKVLKTSEFKIPCLMIAIDSITPETMKTNVINHFDQAFSKTENKNILMNAIGVGRIERLTSEQSSTIEKIVDKANVLNLSNFSKEIYPNN